MPKETARSDGLRSYGENLPYATYQVDPTRFAEVVDPAWQAQAARGGDEDPMLALGVTRKAGAIWLRPHLEFVRSAKTHASPVSVELMSRFAKGLDACRTVVVCGYSWSDAHVNDMILGAAATGANVVNLAYDHDPEPLISLTANKLPTSYEEVLGRIYWIGGGAAAVLEEGSSVLPGDCRDLKSVLEQLKPEWSLVSHIGSA